MGLTCKPVGKRQPGRRRFLMFGKLLKYDFRSMLKQFAFIWPAALGLALVNHFTINSFVASASDMRQTVSGIAMVVYVAILMATMNIAIRSEMALTSQVRGLSPRITRSAFLPTSMVPARSSRKEA